MICTCSGSELSAASCTDTHRAHKSTNVTLLASYISDFSATISCGNTSIPNYRDTSFENADLTQIHGEPTYETLTVLFNQLKANTCSVQTSLGGGQHGYLSLVLSPAQYNITAPNIPFTYPTHPGPLTLPVYQLPHVTQQITSQHTKSIRVFNECGNVEQALRKQIVAAIEPSFLAAIKTRQTNTITLRVYEIMEFVFRNFGCVTPAKLVDKEQQLLTWAYDPALTIVLLYNKIDDLMDLENAAG